MKKYELTVVVSAKIEDEERATTVEKVTGRIAKYGGSVVDINEDGKKKLAYEIQKMTEGYYYFITFETDNKDCPSRLENHLRIMENVIRFMCVSVEA